MDNLNDILASLTPEDIKSLKETADALFGSGGLDFKPPQQQEKTNNNTFFNDSGSMMNPEFISKITQIMSMMNSDGGKRCKLIEALKPNLSNSRQKKADEAMQILKLLELLPIITDLTGKGG